jgi:hypothetical protein
MGQAKVGIIRAHCGQHVKPITPDEKLQCTCAWNFFVIPRDILRIEQLNYRTA